MVKRLIVESRSPSKDLCIIDFDFDLSFITDETRLSMTTRDWLITGIAVTHTYTLLSTE